MTAPSLPASPLEELTDSIFQAQHQPLLRAFLDNSSEGLGIVDTKGNPLFMNARVRNILGIGFSDARPEDWSERYGVFYPDSERLFPSERLPLYRALQGEASVEEELFVRNAFIPEGRHFLSRAWPVRDNQGQMLGAILILRDTETERRAEAERHRAEQQMRELNAELERRIIERTAQLEFSNRELEAFAYSVAHDLRAPLRSISSFSLALTEDCAGLLDATGQEYIQRIRASSQRMAELIDGILALSRVNRIELVESDVHLSGMARSIAEQIQRWKPERTVNIRVQDGLVDRGDAQLLRLVFENLMGNAWKFTRDKPVAEIEFGILPGEGSGRVYFVRDNGAGFDMEYQRKLFGVFQRLHTQKEFEGHGVGLATVQRIIRRHAGRIWGEGRVGEGATFYFTLHEDTAS
ncbi:hypothetical protein BO221_14580 [Archangium sp. Cb G35]|uniref:sensor histidine kinase n=1 Tax=Archangium sp. Cb G35 TaxID=1920190 RepID=UPI000936A0DB|nr:ATP-binding protein [Archangium sp. Cb G35]OJT24385.1 hypothetical protein BO221_14580 [Archangium sp. Cb G35]